MKPDGIIIALYAIGLVFLAWIVAVIVLGWIEKRKSDHGQS